MRHRSMNWPTLIWAWRSKYTRLCLYFPRGSWIPPKWISTSRAVCGFCSYFTSPVWCFERKQLITRHPIVGSSSSFLSLSKAGWDTNSLQAVWWFQRSHHPPRMKILGMQRGWASHLLKEYRNRPELNTGLRKQTRVKFDWIRWCSPHNWLRVLSSSCSERPLRATETLLLKQAPHIGADNMCRLYIGLGNDRREKSDVGWSTTKIHGWELKVLVFMEATRKFSSGNSEETWLLLSE